MLVSDFKKFIRVSTLSDLDVGDSKLTLSPDPLRICYEGLHCAGETRATADIEIAGLPDPISVSAKFLQGALSLLGDDAELQITFEKPSLVLRSHGKRMTLRAGPSTYPDLVRPESRSGAVIVKAAELTSALIFLVDITTRRIASLVLMGVRLTFSDGLSLVLEATDGHRAGVATVDIAKGAGFEQVIVPALDLLTALKSLDEYAILKYEHGSNTFDVLDKKTYIRLAVLQGEFPDLSKLPASLGGVEVEMSRGVISTVVRAAALLDCSRAATLVIEESRAYFQIEGQEIGSFVTAVRRGSFSTSRKVVFDTDYFTPLGVLNDPLVLKIKSPSEPVLVEDAKGWRYWLSPLVLA